MQSVSFPENCVCNLPPGMPRGTALCHPAARMAYSLWPLCLTCFPRPVVLTFPVISTSYQWLMGRDSADSHG